MDETTTVAEGGDQIEGLSPEQLNERPDLAGGSDPGPGVDAPGAGSPPPAGGKGAPTQATTPAQAQAQTIREAAAAYGLDLSGQPDDHAAFVHLIQQAQAARQNDYYTQLGRQLAPQYKGIRGYLDQQRAAAQPAAAPKPWEAPEFDRRWLNLVERDEQTGAFKARPGTNPEYAEKVQRYADYMESFNSDPMKMVGQYVQHAAAEIAGRIYDERHQAVEQRQAVGSIIEQNASWIYQHDANGRRMSDAEGRYLPTPEGTRYVTHVRALAGAGIKDPKLQDSLARQLVSGELYAAQATKANQQAAANTPQARAAVARPPVNPGAAVEPTRRPAVPGASEPSGEGLSLAEMLRKEMESEGITDADFATP